MQWYATYVMFTLISVVRHVVVNVSYRSRDIIYNTSSKFSNDICDILYYFFFFQAEDGIRDLTVTGVQTCALPIAYLFVGVDPTASSTAGHVKFSDAISSIWPRCRSSSRASASAISGSTSVRPAVRSWSSVSCAIAIALMVVPLPPGAGRRACPR